MILPAETLTMAKKSARGEDHRGQATASAKKMMVARKTTARKLLRV